MNRKPDSPVYEIKPETGKALQERYRDATPGQKETTKKSEAEYNGPTGNTRNDRSGSPKSRPTGTLIIQQPIGTHTTQQPS